jgi:hypothetical protein
MRDLICGAITYRAEPAARSLWRTTRWRVTATRTTGGAHDTAGWITRGGAGGYAAWLAPGSGRSPFGGTGPDAPAYLDDAGTPDAALGLVASACAPVARRAAQPDERKPVAP